MKEETEVRQRGKRVGKESRLKQGKEETRTIGTRKTAEGKQT